MTEREPRENWTLDSQGSSWAAESAGSTWRDRLEEWRKRTKRDVGRLRGKEREGEERK